MTQRRGQGDLLWRPSNHVACVPPGTVLHPAQFLPRQLSFYQGEQRTAPRPCTAHQPSLSDTLCSPEPACPPTHALQAPLPSWAPCPVLPCSLAVTLLICGSVPSPPAAGWALPRGASCLLSPHAPRGGSLPSDPLVKLRLGTAAQVGLHRNGLDTQSFRTNENSTDCMAEPEGVWTIPPKICHSGIRSNLSWRKLKDTDTSKILSPPFSTRKGGTVLNHHRQFQNPVTPERTPQAARQLTLWKATLFFH